MNEKENLKKRKSLQQLVVKDNTLVQARYNLTKTQQKFLAYIISKIKPTDKELSEYEIKVEDFCLLCGIDKTWFYSEFIKMIDDFDNNCFWIENDKELYKFRWFSDSTYLKRQGTVRIQLSKRLQQYLLGLTKDFTQYELYNIMALKSKYAIRLFELFKSYQYQQKKTFDVDTLKEMLFATNYKNFADFKKRVIEPAIEEINEYTELIISYEPISKGKKYIAVEFTINHKAPTETYKSYIKTIDEINKANNQIKGQMSIEDYFTEDD